MNLLELKNIINQVGYPLTYSHFTPTQSNPVPEPPYICYLVLGDPNFIADNKVFHKISDVNIELYTKKKDLVAEAKLEAVLNDNDLPYDASEVFIESEGLFQKIYEVRLI
jgi:hypothetical protein